MGQQKAQLVSTGSVNRVVAGDQDKIRKGWARNLNTVRWKLNSYPLLAPHWPDHTYTSAGRHHPDMGAVWGHLCRKGKQFLDAVTATCE